MHSWRIAQTLFDEYNAVWMVMGANEVGAPHRRERTFILAFSNANGIRRDEQEGLQEEIQQSCKQGIQSEKSEQSLVYEPLYGGGADARITWWGAEPGIPRVVNVMADRVDRIHASGNGQVPSVVRKAWYLLGQRIANVEVIP